MNKGIFKTVSIKTKQKKMNENEMQKQIGVFK